MKRQGNFRTCHHYNEWCKDSTKGVNRRRMIRGQRFNQDTPFRYDPPTETILNALPMIMTAAIAMAFIGALTKDIKRFSTDIAREDVVKKGDPL